MLSVAVLQLGSLLICRGHRRLAACSRSYAACRCSEWGAATQRGRAQPER